MTRWEGYATREMAATLAEECGGCGWLFADGGESHVHPIPGDAELTGTVTPHECQYHALCGFCETTLSWRSSNFRIAELGSDLSRIANVILEELRKSQ